MDIVQSKSVDVSPISWDDSSATRHHLIVLIIGIITITLNFSLCVVFAWISSSSRRLLANVYRKMLPGDPDNAELYNICVYAMCFVIGYCGCMVAFDSLTISCLTKETKSVWGRCLHWNRLWGRGPFAVIFSNIFVNKSVKIEVNWIKFWHTNV